MAYNKTIWMSGDVITATKMNNIEEKLESIDNSMSALVNEDITQKVSQLETVVNAGVIPVSVTHAPAEANYTKFIIPSGANTQLLCTGTVNLPVRQDTDGDPSPSNVKPFIPYTNINFLEYTGQYNIINLKQEYTDTSLWTWNGEQVSGSVMNFYYNPIKIPAELKKQIVYINAMTTTHTKIVFYYKIGTSIEIDKEILPVDAYAYQTLHDVYVPSHREEYSTPYDGPYFYLAPTDATVGDTLNVTNLIVTLKEASSATTTADNVSVTLSEPVLGGKVNLQTGEVIFQNANGDNYYLFNSADLNIESFVTVENGINYVVCTRPNQYLNSVICTHYKYISSSNGNVNNAVILSDSRANYKFTINDSRFTDEATARAILENRNNNIEFCGTVGMFALITPTTYNITPVGIPLRDSPCIIEGDGFTINNIIYYKDLNTMLTNLEETKVTKETGKGLSSNDYTANEKAKLQGTGVMIGNNSRLQAVTKNNEPGVEFYIDEGNNSFQYASFSLSELQGLLTMLQYYQSITPFTAQEITALRRMISDNEEEVFVDEPASP